MDPESQPGSQLYFWECLDDREAGPFPPFLLATQGFCLLECRPFAAFSLSHPRSLGTAQVGDKREW